MSEKSCPYCAYTRFWVLRRNKRKCKRCRREWSLKRYLVPQIRSTDTEWKQCIHTFLRERTIKRIVEETTIPHCRVEKMVQHLRQCMQGDEPAVFSGIVEMDETYIGGQRKNKRLHIRRIQGKRGHGTDKLPIVGLFSRSSGEVYIEVLLRKLDVKRIFTIIEERAKPGSMLYTDGFKMYRGLRETWYGHEFVDHLQGEMVRGDVHTNNIEGFWGILKRKLGCIGGMRRDRLHFFVAEIVWKFNHRKMTLSEQEELLLTLIAKEEFGGRK